jgi:hypothetical protein
MHTQKIIDITTDESLLVSSQKDLDAFISRYPQVSIFQSLKAKMLQINKDPNYQIQLKKAAIFSPDRKKLYHYLIQPEISKKIEKVEEELKTEKLQSQNKDIPQSVSEEEKPSIIRSQQSINEKKEGTGPSPLERYTMEKPKVVDPDEHARIQLEREILQHAVSSTILLDVDKLEIANTTEEDSQVDPDDIMPEMNSTDFNGLGVLDWLKTKEGKTTSPTFKKSTKELINKFIKKEPQKISSDDEKKTFIEISRPKHEFFSPENMAKMSLMENEELVTETLAGIYARQGNVSKAAKAYDKLSLKFPEKSDYFARLKKELDNK